LEVDVQENEERRNQEKPEMNRALHWAKVRGCRKIAKKWDLN
jgi:hypothetical protein